jgi:hypothetical protein
MISQCRSTLHCFVLRTDLCTHVANAAAAWLSMSGVPVIVVSYKNRLQHLDYTSAWHKARVDLANAVTKALGAGHKHGAHVAHSQVKDQLEK